MSGLTSACERNDQIQKLEYNTLHIWHPNPLLVAVKLDQACGSYFPSSPPTVGNRLIRHSFYSHEERDTNQI